MKVPRVLAASAVAAGLAFGSAGVVMAASSPPPSLSGDDVPLVPASPEASASPSPSATALPDDSPSASPSASFGDDVPADVVAGLSEIPQSAAVSVAEGAAGGNAGQLERAVLKVEDGRLVWDVRFSSGSKVEIDALSGEAVKAEIRSARTNQSASSVEVGDDRGDPHSRVSSELGDDNGGHDGDHGSGESGDDHGGNSGRGGQDD